MSIDPDKAIEKLSEYRASSKKPEFKDSEHVEEDSPIRLFFIEYYKFNAVIALTIFFALIIGGWSAVGPVWSLLGAVVTLLLTRQTFATIRKLDESEGRRTSIDDTFVVILIGLMFFVLNSFELIPTEPVNFFMILHILLTIIWIVQIVFVNYLKPEGGATRQGGIIEGSGKKTTLVEYFTKQRLILIGIGAVLGFIFSIPVLF